MIQRLNIPKPGEHIYMHGPKLSGMYIVKRVEFVVQTQEYRLYPTPTFNTAEPRYMPVNYIYRTAHAHDDEWLYSTTTDADSKHQVSIVLPTAGRPVFIKLPEDPDMGLLDTISGIVRWAQKDRDGNYSFAMYLESYCQLIADGTAGEYLQRFSWDEKRACWNICIKVGRPAILKSGRLEVAFG